MSSAFDAHDGFTPTGVEFLVARYRVVDIGLYYDLMPQLRSQDERRPYADRAIGDSLRKLYVVPMYVNQMSVVLCHLISQKIIKDVTLYYDFIELDNAPVSLMTVKTNIGYTYKLGTARYTKITYKSQWISESEPIVLKPISDNTPIKPVVPIPDAIMIEVKDGHTPIDKDFNRLVARYYVCDADSYYLMLPQLLNQWGNPLDAMPDATMFRKLYVVASHLTKAADVLLELLKRCIIMSTVIYYGGIVVHTHRPLQPSLLYFKDNSGSAVRLGSHDELSLVNEFVVEEPVVKNQDEDLSLAIRESMLYEKRRRRVLKLGIKNFARTSDAGTLCGWCRIDPATSEADNCEHLLFCKSCLVEYKKSNCNEFCPVCVHDTKFSAWD